MADTNPENLDISKALHKIEVQWTGGGWTLCNGEWLIAVDGIDISEHIPNSIRTSSMYTYKTTFDSCAYEYDPDGEVTFTDGLKFNDWIHENMWWIGELPIIEPEDYPLLYALIQENDFRQGTCGGCI